MAGGVWGQDVGEVKALSAKMKAKAEEIQGIMVQLTNELTNVKWTGPDAERFRSEWSGQYTTQLKAVITGLTTASTTAARNAQQQTDASNAH